MKCIRPIFFLTDILLRYWTVTKYENEIVLNVQCKEFEFRQICVHLYTHFEQLNVSVAKEIVLLCLA